MEEEKQELMAKANMFAQTKDISQAINCLPTAPLDEDFTQELGNKFSNNKNPDKKEDKQLNKKIRQLYKDWRNNCLEQIDLENYKKWCDLQVIKAENNQKLANIKRIQEIESIQHWLKKNEGNLKEINYNTTSKPAMFWYYINRGIFHINKTFNNIPKLVWKILAVIIGVGAIILAVMGIVGVKNNVFIS